jgi:valyl-tRNA synthetase
VARETPARCAYCGSSKIEQDPDVLDTWFSSGLWPFSTLGWPDKTPDYEKYYPTSTLITGRDILFFWAARMIMMGLKFTGQVPFRQLYLHSLVLTAEGQKMSKSKGTGLDPLELTAKFGTDAMRFTLASMAAPGSDIILSDDKILSARAFANKIWNASRFLFVNLEKFEATGATLDELAAPEVRERAPYAPGNAGAKALPLVDRWIFSRLASVTAEVNQALEDFRFHEAAHVVYHFFWGDFCDWYIEWVKPQLTSADRDAAIAAWRNIFAVMESALRLLHPFMPFITEELWHRLPQREGQKSIALQVFPTAKAEWFDVGADKHLGVLQEIVKLAREIRAELKLDPKKKVAADFATSDAATSDLVRQNLDPVLRLAALSSLNVSVGALDSKAGVVRSAAQFDVRIAYGEGVDKQAELARLRKEVDRLAKDIESKKKRLSDEVFLSRAPAEVRQNLENTLAERELEHQKLSDRLAKLG